MNHSILWAKAPSGRMIDIPILGVCGEFGSGKTLFGAAIAPGNHPEGHPYAGKPRTGIIDVEMSSATYEGSALGFERFDLPSLLMKNRSGGFTPIELYEACRKLIDSIPNGRFDVLIIDPVTDIDSGLTDYVKTNCTKFGLTARQLEKSSGLLWGVVKDQWNNWLLQIAQKCKTFVFTAHMRDHYIGNMPSGKREPKGKETLGKLASIYMELSRKPGKDGTVPKAPNARIIKGRLCDMILDAEGEIQNIELLPPVFEHCTPKRIRQFIQSPPTEKVVVPEGHLDSDMKMAFQALIETQRNEANQAELQILDRRKELQSTLPQIPSAEKPSLPTALPPAKEFPTASLKPASLPFIPTAPIPVESPAPPAPAEKASEQSVSEIQYGTQKSSDDPPFNTFPVSEETPWDATPEQMIAEIKAAHAFGTFAMDELKSLLTNFGATKLSELSQKHLTDISAKIVFVKEILEEADTLGIPRSKLDELAKMAKDGSLFLARPETLQNIRQLILNQKKTNDKTSAELPRGGSDVF